MESLERQREWLEAHAGRGITEGMGPESIGMAYRGMRDYDMGPMDVDRWAWLSTLLGYDIGAERAMAIAGWYDGQGMDVLDLGADDGGALRNVCELELGLHLDFTAWPSDDPQAITYGLPECPPWRKAAEAQEAAGAQPRQGTGRAHMR